MTIVRWTPFRGMLDIQDEMNRLFDSFRTRTSDDSGSGQLAWEPSVDIAENDDEIQVHAEVPGMRKEDIKVIIQDNVLTLRGEKRQETEDKKKNYHRIERIFGSFERSFSLPSTVQADKVKASYKDGILNIVLPKAEEAKPKQIDIAVK